MKRRSLLAVTVAVLATACASGGDVTSTAAGTTTGATATTTTPIPGATAATTSTVVDGPPAPDFTLALGSGGEFDLSDEQKPVYMVFWAEW